jgi:hypothetical protein
VPKEPGLVRVDWLELPLIGIEVKSIEVRDTKEWTEKRRKDRREGMEMSLREDQ